MVKQISFKRIKSILIAGAVILAMGVFAYLMVSYLPTPRLLPGSQSQVGLRTKIGLEFQQSMRQWEVEERLRIDEGKWTTGWEGNTVWLYPRSSISTGTITVRLEAGAHSEDGRMIHLPLEARFIVRQPSVVFLSTADQTLWIADITGPGKFQVSHAGARVIDHAPSFDGEWIAYASVNTQKGADIWLVDRSGKTPQLLVECQADTCSSPTWSPDGRQLAFLRQSAQGGFSRPWLVGRDGSSGVPLFDDPAFGGSDLSWSPDGRYISTYDLPGKTIRIQDRVTGQLILVRNDVQTAGSWSADGQEFYYFDIKPSDLPPRGGAFMLDMPTKRVTALFSRGEQGMDYGLPVPAPDGDAILAGRRLALGSHGFQLWLLSRDGSQETAISVDFLNTRGAYSWDPAGKQVVFQQLALGSSRAEPDVLIWDRQSGEITLLAHRAAHPRWLP